MTVSREVCVDCLVRFVDTNILIYSISPNSTETAKQSTTLEILTAVELAVSVQVNIRSLGN